jgi:hypothetical protein
VPEVIDDLVDMISQGINSGKSMEATLGQLKRLADVPDDELNRARFRYESLVGIIRAIPDPAVLVSENTRLATWYPGPRPTDVFWPKVRDQLLLTLSATAVKDVDEASSKILSVMSAPGFPEFSTRGLVLGYVQSGKTTSFISVVAKAADAGYRVFIVLSGVTDNLRSQTQERVDEVLIGENAKGWYRLTVADSDFSHDSANAAQLLRTKDHRFIAVVKKNPARLRKLRDWLKAAGPAVLAGAPILIIDDEADQASIDVAKGKGRTSTINKLLREILLKPKAAYIAYTATPFANLLINPVTPSASVSLATDLYPSDFIVALPEPAGYFGSGRMFGALEKVDQSDDDDDGINAIRSISVEEAEAVRPPKGKGAVNSWEPTMWPALRDSLSWFVLSTAARRVRGKGNKHSTMLVHTSMLAEGHVRLAAVVSDELNRLSEALKASDQDELHRLDTLYERESGRVTASDFGHDHIDFKALEDVLIEVLAETRIVIDNYLSDDRLSYDANHPTTAVVIGGNTLSRGLTLEGLSSSYFVRSASAYDTLLQMGRWFGYRNGYEDLCRVWMTDELASWFRDLSVVEMEIRAEIQRYELENLSPLEVAVRIRTHPKMAITSAAKMRHAVKASMSFSTLRPQTILFPYRDEIALTHNIQSVRNLVTVARQSGRVERVFGSGRRGFSGLSAADIVTFLGDYEFHKDAKSLQSSYLTEYIEKENAAGALLRWNVVFMEADMNSKSERDGIELGLSTAVRPLTRSRLATSNAGVANLKAIVSTMDRASDLDLETSEVRRRATTTSGVTDASLMMLRSGELPGQGLICIYPIDAASKPQGANKNEIRVALDAVEDLIGIALFFPRATGEHSLVDYYSADLSGLILEDIEDELAQVAAADDADNDLMLSEVNQ